MFDLIGMHLVNMTNYIVMKNRGHFEELALKQKRKIRVYDGTLVDPYDMQPEDIKPFVFIHALCCINRFHGHGNYPYSVGQHTRNLVLAVPDHLKRVAFLHDFAEALFNDLASPIKRQNPEYKKAEHECTLRVLEHFGVSEDELDEFDEYDKRIYINERDCVFGDKISELGLNDDMQELNLSKLPYSMEETDWRKVRHDLIFLWPIVFPDYNVFSGTKK